jgi:glycosyltransferase involved in cell wall biosynthesis
MKILQVISSFPPAYAYGGPLKVAYDISKELVKNNHNVTVYTTDVYDAYSRLHYSINPEIMEGITVYRFRNISNFLSRQNLSCAPLMFLTLKNKIRDFDLIHLHEYRSFQAVFVHHYAKKYHIPYVVQAHGAVLPIFEKQGIKKIFDFFWGDCILRDAAKLVAVSKVERDQYLKMGLSLNKIELIPNGIDISEYTILPERGIFRKKYGIAVDEKIILYLGRLHKRKGLEFLINGFSNVLDQSQNVKLVIAGPDDGFLDILNNLIRKLKIGEKVLITGSLTKNEKFEVLVDADVLVYPGIFEIFGLVPFEAIMCETPVIVTDDCGCGEVIKEANCGYLVKFGNITELSTKIDEVLKNSDSAKKMVLHGQRYIKSYLTWNTIIIKFQELYEDCLRNF